MREFTKAITSYLLAMSLFGVKQLENLAATQERDEPHRATEAFDSVTASTVAQLNQGLAQTYRALDATQRAILGLPFGPAATPGEAHRPPTL